jgi:NTE family protein
MTANADAKKDRSGIALALSGGGYRAMLFHAGAVIRLNELRLLKDIKRISSVSGGSIAAAFLGFKWRNLDFHDGRAENLQREFVSPLLDFSRHTIDIVCGAAGLLSQGALVSPVVAWFYDRHLFAGATLNDLPADEDGPRFVICAANLSTGSLFRFSRPYIADWRLGRMRAPDLRLSKAVAASSAFPPLLSPTRINLAHYPVIEEDKPKTVAAEVDFTEIPAALRAKAVLSDGGVYDNHGLEPIDDWQTIYVSDGGMPHDMETSGLWNWYGQTKRVMTVMDNQVRSLRRRALFRYPPVALPGPEEEPPAARTVVYWGIGTNPAKYTAVAGLDCPPDDVLRLSRQSTRLKDPGDAVRFALVNWGYAICDRALGKWHPPADPQPPKWPFPNGISLR